MEKNLAEKQEQLVNVFKKLSEAMPLLQDEERIRMAFTYVFTREPEEVVSRIEKNHDPRVSVLRELRLRSGLSQEKASTSIGKGKTFILRMETGKALLDNQTEKKLLELYKKQQEEKVNPQ